MDPWLARQKGKSQNFSTVFFITYIYLERRDVRRQLLILSFYSVGFGDWTRVSGLEANAFTHWITLQVHVFSLESQVRVIREMKGRNAA